MAKQHLPEAQKLNGKQPAPVVVSHDRNNTGNPAPRSSWGQRAR
jgi:hypothetical protein